MDILTVDEVLDNAAQQLKDAAELWRAGKAAAALHVMSNISEGLMMTAWEVRERNARSTG